MFRKLLCFFDIHKWSKEPGRAHCQACNQRASFINLGPDVGYDGSGLYLKPHAIARIEKLLKKNPPSFPGRGD
jgi:hypothetical protein